MSQPSSWARWAACALALAVAVSPALADKKKKRTKARPSIATCTSFDQVDRADDSVDLVIANSCEIGLACSVSWTLTCAPGTRHATRHQHGQAFSLATAMSQASNASPAECGSQAWAIDDVTWSCQPEVAPPAP